MDKVYHNIKWSNAFIDLIFNELIPLQAKNNDSISYPQSEERDRVTNNIS